MKLSTAIRRFDQQMRADGKLGLTRSIYLRDLNTFKSWLGKDPDIRSITPQILTRFLTSKPFTHTATGTEKATISLNRAKSAYRTFFRLLVDAGYLRDNPARLVRFAKSARRPPSYLTDGEIKQLLATIKRYKTTAADRDHVMFSILIGTGIRLGSLVAINAGDVNLGQGLLRINSKGNVERFVFLNTQLKRLIKSYLAGHSPSPDDPLFTSIRSKRIGSRQVQLRLDHWLDLAGITRRCTPHTLRHSFATWLYEKTNDIRLVQRALGHKNVTTTEIYTHIADAKLRRAVQLLSSLG